MTVLVLDGMPRPLAPATPARLTTWLDCPRRYRFAYVDRPAPPKGPPWAHNAFGATVHNVLKAWTTRPVALRTTEAVPSLVASHWISDGYRDEEQQARQRERAVGMVSAYVGTLDPLAEPAGVERTVAARLPGIALSGRVDRIDRRGDELAIVDYKTGRSALSEDDARGSLALALYAVAAERTLRRTCRTVELHHLPTGEVHAFRHTEESLARHVGRATAIAEEARDATSYEPRPGPGCGWCDFVRLCPEGRAASPERAPWDGLPG